jgi:LPXTG-motif cell wall-anchored protein
MLGISSLLALIGLLLVIVSAIFLLLRRKRNLAFAGFITGLLLIFLPGTLINLFLN